MNAEIVAVGSELLLGQIDNTNATYLSKELSKMGINVFHHTVVGDNRDRFYDVVQTGMKRSDLIIFTGGLGPTKDDLTKETIAEAAQKELVYDADTEKRIHTFFKRRNREMTPNNRKQAMVLQGAEIFPNDHGLACGMAVEAEDTRLILLPGPPKELIPMFENYTVPYLAGNLKSVEAIQSKVLRFFDIGESQLVHKVDDLIEAQSNPTLAPLASDGEVTLRMTVKGPDNDSNAQLLAELKEKVLERAGDYFYGEGEDDLAALVKEKLIERKETLAAAESLTGGKFSASVTGLSGASSVFTGAVICYSNAVKQSELGITDDLLNTDGAVSARCAEELASGIRAKLNAGFGISFTGVAGPDRLEGHPPGLVFIGIAGPDGVASYKVQLAGSRENIRDRAVKYGHYYLLKELRKEKVDA